MIDSQEESFSLKNLYNNVNISWSENSFIDSKSLMSIIHTLYL